MKKEKHKTYYVEGMHCSACEVLLEKDIEKIKNVKGVDASLKNGRVAITANKKGQIPSIDELNNLFLDEGYTFYNEKPKNAKATDKDKAISIIVVSSVIALFITLEKSGFFIRFSLNSVSSAPTYFVFGLAAGASSCAALVGGLLLSLSEKWNKVYSKSDKDYIPFALFNIGRLVSFAVLGGLLGLIGSTLQISIVTTAFLTIIISIVMVILGLQMIGFKGANKITLRAPKFITRKVNNEQKLTGKYMPFIIGGLTFFLPCGFTLIAQANALNTGSAITSAILMTAFALGTLPMLLFISFSSIKFYNSKKLNKVFTLSAGTLVIFFALYTLNAQLNVLGFFSINDLRSDSANELSDDIPVIKAKDTGRQVIEITASQFKYSPSSITIKAGVPTTLRIDNKGVVGCASALYARGLYDEVLYLKPGINEVNIPNPKKGTYKVSCSMGMVAPVTVKVI